MTDTPLPFTGRTVLVTGNIDGFTRDQARAAIETLGGEAALGVTKKVDLVVLGEGAGISKTAKARDYNVPVLTGEAFASLSAHPEDWDGTPVGISFADWDALQGPPPAPEPVDPEARNHWVAMAVVHAPESDGEIRRQVRLLCECGHRWMRRELFGNDKCPRPTTPVTAAPWEDPDTLAGLR